MTTGELVGVAEEFKFWQGFVQTERFQTQWAGDFPNPELNPVVRSFIESKLPARVLDVGSGVVSILRGTVPSVDLVAVDPLGSLYQCLFDYSARGITPPVTCPGEELSSWFPSFDVVHMSNALDHTQDPLRVFDELLEVTRPGGYLIIQGFVDEAKHTGKLGFHQWDIGLHQLELRIGTVILGKASELALVTKAGNRDWFVWATRKSVG